MRRASSRVNRASVSATAGPFSVDQYFASRLEELLDPFPGVGNDARAGAGRLEHPGRRAEAVGRHAVAADVQHRQRRGVEGVMVAREDVAEIADIGRQGLVVPAAAAEQKLSVGQVGCHRDKELVDPALAVGQAVGEEPEVAQKAGRGATG